MSRVIGESTLMMRDVTSTDDLHCRSMCHNVAFGEMLGCDVSPSRRGSNPLLTMLFSSERRLPNRMVPPQLSWHGTSAGWQMDLRRVLGSDGEAYAAGDGREEE